MAGMVVDGVPMRVSGRHWPSPLCPVIPYRLAHLYGRASTYVHSATLSHVVLDSGYLLPVEING
jgi:hypothetical protein